MDPSLPSSQHHNHLEFTLLPELGGSLLTWYSIF